LKMSDSWCSLSKSDIAEKCIERIDERIGRYWI